MVFTDASWIRSQTASGDANYASLTPWLCEVAKGLFRTVAVFDDLGHLIAATRKDGGDKIKSD